MTDSTENFDSGEIKTAILWNIVDEIRKLLSQRVGPPRVLCIDGGGTKCAAIIVDRDGRVLGHGQGGPCNVSDGDCDGAIATLSAAVDDVMRDFHSTIDVMFILRLANDVNLLAAAMSWHPNIHSTIVLIAASRPPRASSGLPKAEANHELLLQSSQDITLTALAQLGALRLNVQRYMISLVDRRTQYILSEATRTINLQNDHVHVDGDALWLGSSVIPKAEGICHYVCIEPWLNAGHDAENLTNICSERHCAFVAPDLTKDDCFNQRQYIVMAPCLRFYAGVPVRSRHWITIAAFSVSDGLTQRAKRARNPIYDRYSGSDHEPSRNGP
ncbi:hypothetical protein BJX63DRAFT_436551 [Aspergillus granulosus]|uniref:N-acetyl-D-glucosamine kinase n=1 Tax=Aspergillus granulosus TaxID=176169 RepID=A0ABR4GZ94_9EURO